MENKHKISEELYVKYAQSLANYGQKQWRLSEDQAWDITYKSLIKFQSIQASKEFVTESQKRSYLFRIFINYLKNYLRDKRQVPGEKQGVELKDIDQPDIEEGVDSFELSLIKDILDEFEDWERTLLLLRQQNVSYKIIANYIDKPEKQLKVYYSRAKAKLKREFINRSKNKKAS